jgi:hypothetical protein
MIDRCRLCRHHRGPFVLVDGEPWCSDSVNCHFRARRRLGLPLHLCVEHKARDLERRARLERGRAERIASMPPPSRSDEYRAYLGSQEWRAFADEQKRLADYRCEDCRVRAWDVEAHHLSYGRLGRERPEDVIVLCSACHMAWDDERRASGGLRVGVEVGRHGRVVSFEEPA